MRKLLVTLVAMVMMTSTAAFAASETPVSDWINKQTSKITQKEQDANAKAAAAKKKQQAKVQKEREKAAKARAKQQEKIKKEKEKAAKKQAAAKSKIQTKKQQLKELFTVE